MENGDAYPCFCSTERLAEMRVEIGGAKYAKAKYDRRCTHLSKQEADDRMESGESYIIRMKIPSGTTSFKDIVHGKVVFENKTIDD